VAFKLDFGRTGNRRADSRTPREGDLF